jgi:hypothetical protein
MTMTATGVSAVRRLLSAAGMALLAANATGCSALSEQTVGSALTSPGKYEFHDCQDIQSNIRNRRNRQAELEKLMAQASQGFGGEFVSAIAYRSEYVKNRGDIDVLVRTAAEKQCVTQSPWSSERAVF